MDRKQVAAAFDELEAENPMTRARVWLDATDADGGTVSIVVDRGDYDLFMEEGLLVTRYDYEDRLRAELYGRPVVRRVGANFIPFDIIQMVELMAKVAEE